MESAWEAISALCVELLALQTLRTAPGANHDEGYALVIVSVMFY